MFNSVIRCARGVGGIIIALTVASSRPVVPVLDVLFSSSVVRGAVTPSFPHSFISSSVITLEPLLSLAFMARLGECLRRWSVNKLLERTPQGELQ